MSFLIVNILLKLCKIKKKKKQNKKKNMKKPKKNYIVYFHLEK